MSAWVPSLIGGGVRAHSVHVHRNLNRAGRRKKHRVRLCQGTRDSSDLGARFKTATRSTKGIDLSFRPDTCWPESPNREQLLVRIKGQARRELVCHVLKEYGLRGINAFNGIDDLPNDTRRHWGGIHPWYMGGEYLPSLAEGEVEIARISLASGTYDQHSIRALQDGTVIRLSVVDEYETEYELAFREALQPLSFAELIRLIDGSRNPDDHVDGGLVQAPWNSRYSEDGDSEGAVAFVSLESAFYPDLKSYYETLAERWQAERREEDEDDLDEDERVDEERFR